MGARVAWLALLFVLAAAACGGSAPEVPVGPDGVADPVLLEGREVWASTCARCHGGDGGGGRGPRLNGGRVVDAYPDVTDQVVVVAEGLGQMPSFADQLDAGEIEAVVRYTREVL